MAARVWRSPGSLREAERYDCSCLIRLIHLLSLYREVYLTPKQATNGLRPNRPLTPLTSRVCHVPPIWPTANGGRGDAWRAARRGGGVACGRSVAGRRVPVHAGRHGCLPCAAGQAHSKGPCLPCALGQAHGKLDYLSCALCLLCVLL